MLLMLMRVPVLKLPTRPPFSMLAASSFQSTLLPA
jgi:hypothetical protein